MLSASTLPPAFNVPSMPISAEPTLIAMGKETCTRLPSSILKIGCVWTLAAERRMLFTAVRVADSAMWILASVAKSKFQKSRLIPVVWSLRLREPS